MSLGLYVHPETTSRLEGRNPMDAIYNFIEVRDSINRKSTIPLKRIDISEYLTVHDKAYVEGLQTMSRGEEPREHISLSLECLNMQYFLPGYEFSLGGFYSAIDLMKKGILNKAYCWSLPGHHASSSRGHGYCLLNPMAASIKYAQKNGFKNVLVIDWDIHHGDGTQTIFENDSSVYQISIHSAVDLYMSIQRVTQKGYSDYGESVGHCNIPVMSLMHGRDFYNKLGKEFSGELYTDKNCIEKFLSSLENLPFDPDIIFVFDGHDSHIDDCGENITNWNDDDFVFLTKTMISFSKKKNCPLISTSGGGYNQKTNSRLTNLHIRTLED
jgi:acetoin utilization deacetylase AcuC-like enzyme